MALNTNLKTFSICSIASRGSWKGCFGFLQKKRRENAKRKTFGLRWCRANPLEKQRLACRAARRSLGPTKQLLTIWANYLIVILVSAPSTGGYSDASLVSLFSETKDFFCFLCHKRCRQKTGDFLRMLFLENEEQSSEKNTW